LLCSISSSPPSSRVPADPVAAYVLYGEAAQLGIPTARSNQIAIFETRLTQQQRQLVLMREQTK
jgi:hypothetical protein